MARERIRVGGAVTVILLAASGATMPETTVNLIVSIVGIFDPLLGALSGAAVEQTFNVEIYDGLLFLAAPLADLAIEYQLHNPVYAVAVGAGIGIIGVWIRKQRKNS